MQGETDEWHGDWDENVVSIADHVKFASERAHWSEDGDWDRQNEANVCDDNGNRPLSEENFSTEWEDDGSASYLANEREQNTLMDEHEMVEMNYVACLYDMLGEDAWSDPDMCARVDQDGMTACFGPKGPGKGRGKGTKGKYPIRR